jgi:hypothetical protein
MMEAPAVRGPAGRDAGRGETGAPAQMPWKEARQR